jgi:iron complex outermembrane receptor protein
MRRGLTFGICVSAGALLFVLIAGAAVAQQLSPAARDTEEIVVTALKRSETLSQVPAAIDVVTAQEMDDAHLETPADVLALTPGLSYVQSGDAGTSFITVRGISQIRNGESPVAVIIDGVEQPDTTEFNERLYDVQQIEVLKGPQGALYGRNAEGGAINITTQQPTDEFAGKLFTGFGNGGQVYGGGLLSGPLVKDQLLFRLAAEDSNFDGLIPDDYLHSKVDPYTERSGRGELIYTPRDGLEVDLRGDIGESHGGALYYVESGGNANNTSVPIVTDVTGFDDRTFQDWSARILYTTELGQVAATSGFNRSHEAFGSAADPYYAGRPDPATQAQDTSKRNISQEIRLTSPDDVPLRYMLGAYYLSLNERIQTTNGVDVNGTVSPGVLGPGSSNPTLTDLEDQRFNTAYAFFGQLEYRFLTDFDLTGGLRYDNQTTSDISAAPPRFETPGAFDGETRSTYFDALQPKVTLKYDGLANTVLYAVYSTGFRSGGFNQAGVATIAAAAGDALVRDQYPKETSINYELGLKTRLPGTGISVQGSAYHTIVSNQQYYSFVPAASSEIISSIEKVHIDGAELEAACKLDQYLQASLGLAWTNAVIAADSFSPGDVGHQAPYVPKNQINLTIQYERPIMDNLTGLARIDYERKGSQFWDTDNSTARNPLDLVNARVALETLDGWTVGAWVKNLLDVRYNEEYDEGGFALIAEPRSFGVDAQYKF